MKDDYFLNSGDCIRYFFEEHALGPDGQLVVPKSRALNKIGHGALGERGGARSRTTRCPHACKCWRPDSGRVHAALHELDPDFRAFSLNERVRAVARSLKFVDPLVLQSMVIYKVRARQAEGGGHA